MTYGWLYRVILIRIDPERVHHLSLNALSLMTGPRRLRRLMHLLQIGWCPVHGPVWTPFDFCPACNGALRGRRRLSP